MNRESPSDVGTPSRVLITGADGFTGLYLRRYLEEKGYDVYGLTLAAGGSTKSYQADLLDFDSLKRVVGEVRPYLVVHLAAMSSTVQDELGRTYLVNILGTRNLLASLTDTLGLDLQKVLIASSGNIYGNQSCGSLAEEAQPHPVNDYAVSKLSMELMANLWSDRIPITIARPFNYTGKGQSDHFLIPKIVNAFRRRDATIELGNTHIERDFSDVRDIVSCYERLLTARNTAVINVCSGIAVSLREVIATCEAIAGHRIAVARSPGLVRGNEIHRLVGNRDRLSALGVPEFRPFRETLAWMLN